MRSMIIASAAIAAASPVIFATPASAMHTYRHELRQCNRELQRVDPRIGFIPDLDRCRRALRQGGAGDWHRWSRYDYNRYEPGYNGYYADRYYRDGSYYPDRRLTYHDRIYRGQNGRYYCRRSDGTTGLIIGGGLGALAGNQISLGGSRTVRTIIGGAAGAVIGREIDRGSLRCN